MRISKTLWIHKGCAAEEQRLTHCICNENKTLYAYACSAFYPSNEMGQNTHFLPHVSTAHLSKMPWKSLLPNLHLKSLSIIDTIIYFAVFASDAYPSGEVYGSHFQSAEFQPP